MVIGVALGVETTDDVPFKLIVGAITEEAFCLTAGVAYITVFYPAALVLVCAPTTPDPRVKRVVVLFCGIEVSILNPSF